MQPVCRVVDRIPSLAIESTGERLGVLRMCCDLRVTLMVTERGTCSGVVLAVVGHDETPEILLSVVNLLLVAAAGVFILVFGFQVKKLSSESK